MIKQLLTTAMLTAIQVNGTHVRVILDMATMNVQTAQYYDNQYQMYNYSQKTTNNTEQNQYLDIHTNNYSSNKYYDNNGSKTFQLFLIYIVQITPYYNMANTEMELTNRIAIDLDTDESIDLTYSLFYTQDTNCSTYIDRIDWNNYNYYEWEADLKLMQNNYYYYLDEEESLENNFGNNEIWTDLTATSIPIQNDKTTYVILTALTNWKYRQAVVNQNDSFQMYVNNLDLYGTLTAGPTTNIVEIVDIPGLMFTILTMPFAFISQAFDLTLFPGTAYQVNIGNLFLGLIGVAIMLWVLKIILGKANLGDMLNDSQKARNDRKLEKLQHKNKMEREKQRHDNAMQEKSQKGK